MADDEAQTAEVQSPAENEQKVDDIANIDNVQEDKPSDSPVDLPTKVESDENLIPQDEGDNNELHLQAIAEDEPEQEVKNESPAQEGNEEIDQEVAKNDEEVPVIDVEENNLPDQDSQDQPKDEETEQDNDETATMPINDAIMEEEESVPEIEIANHSVSHGSSPVQSQEYKLDDQEVPDAQSTPPPPQIEEEKDQEHEEFQDFYERMKENSEQSTEYPIFDRARLLERYKESLEERSQLQNTNNQLQHKLAEYFKKKKTDERVQEIEKNVTDQEQRYLKYISNLDELQNEEKRQEGEMKFQIEELKHRCQDKQEKVDMASNEYMKFKYDIAKASVNSRSGKQFAVKDLEQFQVYETKKELEVIQVRLENIKLKNRLRKKEQQLKAKEELAEGLHLIDFEQLKIENQTYNEKIEERNEEILKLRKKITTTVQVLTHLKEKLQFVQGENGLQRGGLKQIDSTVAQKRDILTRTKQVRDSLRIDNVKLKQKCGLLGNEHLLRDFEVRKDEGHGLGTKLEDLRTEHVGLSMNLNGLKKKIRQSRNHSA